MSATSELVKKLANGNGSVHVEVATGEHTGEKVSYKPRSAKDRLPWVLDTDDAKRFSGKDCKAV